MSKVRTRGISLVYKEKVAGPNRKEPSYIQVEYMVRCNASIPLDHKNFQSKHIQYAEEPVPVVKTKKDNFAGKKKLNKWKKELL